MSLPDLIAKGFDVQTVNHAAAVLIEDFPDPLAELCEVLADVHIVDVELLRGGGGEAPFTQRLRQSLTDRNWVKRNIVIRKTVDDIERATISHEIDHVRRTDNGAIALEIEWNNKDPFFDRDLESFQRLHSEGAISVGVIVTRGQSMQRGMHDIVARCAMNHGVQDFDDLAPFDINPTPRQRAMVKAKGARFIQDWSRRFVQDKFGTATTHWSKLQERIARGVGNPCPLLLVGLSETTISQEKIQ